MERIELTDRNCSCCNSNNVEQLWSYLHLAKTKNKLWEFNVNNVICKNCGFIYVAPVYNNVQLLQYYRDSFSKFSQQSLDYNVEKRLEIIKKYASSGKNTFFELGSNRKSSFHTKLNALFGKVITVEPNEGEDSDHNDMNEIEDGQADVVAHYFVLEHIPSPIEFLQNCNKYLRSGGIMICEVPGLEMYKKYISPLILFEHVNHFTPKKLELLASKAGFQEIETSYSKCSRPFGFVSVFRKNDKHDVDLKDEYGLNKSLFIEGLEIVRTFFEQLRSTVALIKEKSKNGSKIIVWAANETTNRLFINREVADHVTVIDTDPGKKTYFEGNIDVFEPHEVIEQIVEADYIVICTELHADSILTSIKESYNKVFERDKIVIIDRL